MTGRDALQGLRLSGHARDAMRRRDVWPEEVARVLVAPDVVTADGAGRRRYVAGDLAVVVADEDSGPLVVTVLLRSRSRWTDEDCRRRSA